MLRCAEHRVPQTIHVLRPPVLTRDSSCLRERCGSLRLVSFPEAVVGYSASPSPFRVASSEPSLWARTLAKLRGNGARGTGLGSPRRGLLLASGSQPTVSLWYGPQGLPRLAWSRTRASRRKSPPLPRRRLARDERVAPWRHVSPRRTHEHWGQAPWLAQTPIPWRRRQPDPGSTPLPARQLLRNNRTSRIQQLSRREQSHVVPYCTGYRTCPPPGPSGGQARALSSNDPFSPEPQRARRHGPRCPPPLPCTLLPGTMLGDRLLETWLALQGLCPCIAGMYSLHARSRWNTPADPPRTTRTVPPGGIASRAVLHALESLPGTRPTPRRPAAPPRGSIALDPARASPAVRLGLPLHPGVAAAVSPAGVTLAYRPSRRVFLVTSAARRTSQDLVPGP